MKVICNNKQVELECVSYPVPVPTLCHICSSKLVKEGVHYFCRNEECAGRAIELIKCWITKRNIKYIGDALLDELYTSGLVKKPWQLYHLTEEKLAKVKIGRGVVGSNAIRIMREIEQSKICTTAEFMGSLGIEGLGRRQSEIIMQKLGISTIAEFRKLTPSDLQKHDGFGDTNAVIICDGIKKADALITEMSTHIRIKYEAKEEATVAKKGKLNGQSFCFTGKVERVADTGERFTRARLWELVVENGGVVAEDVNSNTNFLVQADVNSVSSKSKKAAKHGTKIISEADFFKMIA